jgi:hypothetical protein
LFQFPVLDFPLELNEVDILTVSVGSTFRWYEEDK